MTSESEQDEVKKNTTKVNDNDFAEPRELYRHGEMIELTVGDWLAALALFQECGWETPRRMGAYVHPLSFVKHDEGEAMQRAGQALFKKIDEEPVFCTVVPMDLGLFYRITEFVGGGAFIVGRKGAYENAKTYDWSE